jgi:DegV family protein with EDD domain
VGAAARAIKAGADLEQAAQTARRLADRMHTYFVVDTLEYLHKGGRIGGASRYLGAALQIKPILTFDKGGKIDALDRIRTKSKALERLLELVQEGADGQPIHAGVVHAQAPEEAARLRSRLEDRFECLEVETYELSPVIGTHVGPGTLGIAMYPDEQPSE